jgi:hypothetical protein
MRYRVASGAGKGKFISEEAVFSLTEKAISQVQDQASSLHESLFKGETSLRDWELEMLRSIRQTSIWQYAMGRGGVGRLSQRDYGIIGAEMRSQASYLRNFSEEVQAGELSEAQIKSRANSYFSKTYGLHERGREEAHREAGYLYERRIRESQNPCAECIFYSERGWVLIGTLPSPTSRSSCGAHCRCRKQFAKELSKQEKQPFAASRSGFNLLGSSLSGLLELLH